MYELCQTISPEHPALKEDSTLLHTVLKVESMRYIISRISSVFVYGLSGDILQMAVKDKNQLDNKPILTFIAWYERMVIWK